MTQDRGRTFSVSVFHVENPPDDGVTGPQPWMAIATAHVFNPTVEVKGLDPTGVLLSGEAMRAIHGKASAQTEEEAAR